jgi:hypothetical protein
MIWYYLVQFILYIYTSVLDFLHVEKIAILPFGTDAFFLNIVGNINALGELLPVLQEPWFAMKWFVHVVLLFIGLIIFRILP